MGKKGIKQYHGKPLLFESKSQREMAAVFGEYSRRAKEVGAILCCVLKGKVAEGIDLAQELCRGLIVIGVPFSPVQCPRIEQKKAFLLSEGRDPQAWYTAQAMRAVCQAMGRAVRNKNDFGAIILADHRYARADLLARLPTWAQNSLKQWDSVMDMRISLTEFFAEHPPPDPDTLPDAAPDLDTAEPDIPHSFSCQPLVQPKL